jgi:photosystem II stability/assembly factor-like uncharacterized protein
MKHFHILLSLLLLFIGININAQKKHKKETQKDNYFLKTTDLSCLKFRSIGPAMISGRIIDIAVNPENTSEYYVAAASGGVFKTTNSGITFTAIFDNQKPYSVGCISIDPNNSNVLWIGSGENNSQRSVSWGDGVYKSLDGGKSWKNMGLKNSEHIGKILIDPRNSNVIWVAAQGPLWNAGGERGLYKSTDGGNSWELSLEISENTGVSDIAFDPENADIVYATAYQRRRHVYTLIDGGPEGGIYKTENGGKDWRKINKGLTGGDKGRIGIAVSPVDGNYVYAIVEAEKEKGGFYRSTNKGESWEKMNSFVSGSPQYYQELIADPKDKDCVYAMDTYARYTMDGGKTFTKFNYTSKHVDDHALWIDPNNTNHLLNGCDGGVYESWDKAKTWDYKANLPLSQFYRVAVDNDLPFYNVYGGTQDNNSVGGPSQTINAHGIRNSDWFITQGGDGFESQVDPTDPNTVYAQAQYGWLARYNKATGLGVDIRPSEPDNGEAYRWNWDAPLLISPHNSKRLYFAANKLFRSDDRGDNWKVISPDLTRQINRNELKIMGKIQSPEAVAKNASTSIYGNIVSFDESPKKEGLLYVGTDDGLMQISEDGGNNWTKVSTFAGVPETTYVSCIKASQYDENIVFASFDNHKRGDFKPYILKSTNKGKTWTSIANNLPEGEVVWSIAQDHVDADLLFAGTEYGIYVSINGGKNWVKMNSGLPSIAVRDIDIQKRENDLVIATYGRGFYILDDYSPLRELKKAIQEEKNYIFALQPTLMFVPSHPIGWRKKGHFGDNFYVADNPQYGAVFTYYIDESYESLKSKRKKEEKKKFKNNEVISYPSIEEFKKEDKELDAYMLFTIKDKNGDIVKKLKSPISKGLHRIAWDYRYKGIYPTSAKAKKNNLASQGQGRPAMPGTYTIEMAKVINESITPIGNKQSFVVKSLYNNRQQANPELSKFYTKMESVAKTFGTITSRLSTQEKQLDLIIASFKVNSNNPEQWIKQALSAKNNIDSLKTIIYGDKAISSRFEAAAPGLQNRLYSAIYEIWNNPEGLTGTHRKDVEIVESHNESILKDLKENQIVIDKLNQELDRIGAPFTPGR